MVGVEPVLAPPTVAAGDVDVELVAFVVVTPAAVEDTPVAVTAAAAAAATSKEPVPAAAGDNAC